MPHPFTNIHMHVFTADCAPDRFLRILPNNMVRRFSKPIKAGLESKVGRKIIGFLATLGEKKQSNKSKEFGKYIAFLDVGTAASQLEIFKRAFDVGLTYDHAVRLIGLTLNMDYMDSKPSVNQLSFETQLAQVRDIKRYYPSSFFPFLGVDPRHRAGDGLVQWARPFFENGVMQRSTGKVYPYFCGLKLYPALGFFPFDPRLEELYRYAERHQLPVISHCTRSGSQYIGEKIEHLIPQKPLRIELPGNDVVAASFVSVDQRIATYYLKNWIKDNKLSNHDKACDLFGHPQNYVVLLEKFPLLKICLAHMGGSNEIHTNKPSGELKEIREVDTVLWFDLILEMMVRYPNLYTDISYTVSDFNEPKILERVKILMQTPDKNGVLLAERVLFGTDFFMTEQEAREADLYKIAQEQLAPWFDKITRQNPQRFLMQPV